MVHIKYIILILLVLLLLPSITALKITSPENGAILTNNQPLLTWTDYPGELDHYEIQLTNNLDHHSISYDSAESYFQIQNALGLGEWTWKVITHTNSLTNESEEANFTLIKEPSYEVTLDTSSYDKDKKVVFSYDTPLHSAVDSSIKKTGFELPFTTDDLQTKEFTTFLDPGTYTLHAKFTFNGEEFTYDNTFTLVQTIQATEEINEHILGFNISNEENEALNRVKITIEDENEDETIIYTDEGWVQKTLPEGIYKIKIYKSGYEEEKISKTLLKSQNLTILLSKKEIEPEIEETILPTIEIVTPVYKEELTNDMVEITYTVTEKNTIRKCDLYRREIKGWVVEKTTEMVEATNVINAHFTQGDQSAKIVCTLKNNNKASSNPRTFTIVLPPKDHEGIQKFRIETQEIQLPKDPLFSRLNQEVKITEMKKELTELEKKYKQKEEGIETLIEQTLKKNRKEIIKEAKIIDRSEQAITPQTSSFEGLEDYEKMQENYLIRGKIVVAELTSIDGSTSYITGITRLIQSFEGELPEGISVQEQLASPFLQASGKPIIIDDNGKQIGTIHDGIADIPLGGSDSYTLIFEGNIKNNIPEQAQIAILEHIEEKEQEEQDENMLTGFVTGLSAETGISASAFLIWIIVLVIVIGMFANPVYTISDWRHDKKVKELTELIHEVVDHLEKNRHEKAFAAYPQILILYQELKPEAQKELKQIMNHLQGQLNTKTIRTMLNHAARHVREQPHSPHIEHMTKHIIHEFKLLEPEFKQSIHPLMERYRDLLRAKRI